MASPFPPFPSSPGVIDQAIATQAAEYFFLLQSQATPQEIEACAQWRAADPQHEYAWQQAQHISRKLGVLPPALASAALRPGQPGQRRQAVKVLALLLGALPVGWMTWRSEPVRAWRADYRSAIGQTRALALTDGSKVYLNTNTAVDVRFDRTQRLLTLMSGEILVETGADEAAPDGYRPLAVETPQGRMRALGTRFMVRHDENMSRVAVFEGRVELTPQAAAERALVLQPGQQTRMSTTVIDVPQALSRHADSWLQGKLYASDMRLDALTAELGRYRRGVVRCDPEVAALRISGVFQLGDTEQVLNSLPNALPVQVLYRTRYWVTLVAAT